MKKILLIKKKGYIGATLLFILSNALKIGSIIILCTTHTRHHEIPHNNETITVVKKMKNGSLK